MAETSAAGAIDGFARRCRGVAADCGLLFLPVHDAFGARGNDAGVDRWVRPDGSWRRVASRALLLRLRARSASSPALRWTRLDHARLSRLGAATVAVGAILFATGDPTLGAIGRFLQGAGGVFALIGAVAIATSSLPASRAATLIGVTQMFGMAGGSAGQFVVGPVLAAGLPWKTFWIVNGRDRFADCRRCSCSLFPNSRRRRRSSGLGSSADARSERCSLIPSPFCAA